MRKTMIFGAIIFIILDFVESAPSTQNGAGCTTPGGEAGSCVRVHDCPKAMTILAAVKINGTSDTPVSSRQRQELENLKKSRCVGQHEYSVCCAYEEPYCGNFPADRIIPSNISAIDAYPWLVVIEYKQNEVTKLLCGGSLLNQRYILTAAHCVHGKILHLATPSSVRLGDYDTSKDPDCVLMNSFEDCTDPIQTIGVDKIVVHPEYDESTKNNNIALIRLKENAKYSDFVQPACLPSANVDLLTNNWLPVSGWKLSPHGASPNSLKMQGALEIDSMDNCRNTLNLTERYDKQICTRGFGNCMVDAGGPLMRMREGRWQHEVVGVANVLPRDCDYEDRNAVFTEVYKYIDWIGGQIHKID